MHGRHLAMTAALLALRCALAVAAPAAPGVLMSDYFIGESLPPITPAERALTAVPSAPGAPAVVLVDAEQTQWAQKISRQRIFRRTKILTEAGVHSHGDYA